MRTLQAVLADAESGSTASIYRAPPSPTRGLEDRTSASSPYRKS